MAEGYKDFTDGSRLYAAEIEEYAQNQAVMRFASAAARDTALATVKTEGMLAYLKDVDQITWYDGSAWNIALTLGAFVAWTPTITQLGSVSCTVTRAGYHRSGRRITADFKLAVTGSGTAANAIVIGGLPFTAAASQENVGVGGLIDTSASSLYSGFVHMASTTTLQILGSATASTYPGGVLGTQQFTAGLASGDTVYGSFAYEAAS